MGESASSAALQCMLFEARQDVSPCPESSYLAVELGSQAVNRFEQGTCYLSPILGALMADSRWGRYKTIIVFSGKPCSTCSSAEILYQQH